MPMIENRGTVKLDAATMLAPDDQVVVIEAYEASERQRVHELMTEDWQLIALVRRRDADGQAYTEYQLRAPRPLA
ncbi:MAG: hypothetical protein IT340_10940 [Chloroflexi bacterium]|nr:hypothetical protein [Chloroflexota bacterium]